VPELAAGLVEINVPGLRLGIKKDALETLMMVLLTNQMVSGMEMFLTTVFACYVFFVMLRPGSFLYGSFHTYNIIQVGYCACSYLIPC